MARKPRAPVEREFKAEELLLNAVTAAGGLCKKIKFIGTLGAPDRLVLLPGGRLFFVELKSPTGPMQPSQEVVFPKLERRGFPVHILRGTKEVYEFIDSHLTQERQL